MPVPLNIGTEKALQKIRRYCAYQERSHREVKEKLYGFGLYKNQVDEILSLLIADNYCNEERYAQLFAGGKFRVKDWGRNRIAYALKQQQVSAYCIKKALASIEEDAYREKLNKLFRKKWTSLKTEGNQLVRKKKTRDYLIGKGYENGLIQELLSNI